MLVCRLDVSHVSPESNFCHSEGTVSPGSLFMFMVVRYTAGTVVVGCSYVAWIIHYVASAWRAVVSYLGSRDVRLRRAIWKQSHAMQEGHGLHWWLCLQGPVNNECAWTSSWSTSCLCLFCCVDSLSWRQQLSNTAGKLPIHRALPAPSGGHRSIGCGCTCSLRSINVRHCSSHVYFCYEHTHTISDAPAEVNTFSGNCVC